MNNIEILCLKIENIKEVYYAKTDFCSRRFGPINRRIPKCNTLLQTENDLFKPEIQPNSPGLPIFGPSSDSKILRVLGIVQLSGVIFHYFDDFVPANLDQLSGKPDQGVYCT